MLTNGSAGVNIADARQELRELIRQSDFTLKTVAETVGEEYTTYSKRLRGKVAGYRQLDLALVMASLNVLGVSFVEFAARVEARATTRANEGERAHA